MRLSLAEIAEVDNQEWTEISAKLAARLAQWRRGQIPLSEALIELPMGTTVEHCPVKYMERSVTDRLDKALQVGMIDILEFQNRDLDRNAPQRVLITQTEEVLLSATLIDQ